MKIAVLGKGGSGKSTISWLLVNYLANLNHKVLAIDADHNMDLTSNLGYEFNDSTPTIHHSHKQFRELVGLEPNQNWREIVLGDKILPSFSYNPSDEFTTSISVKITPNIDLINVGLGSDDILYSDKCAHGHTAPLKFYLPLLKEKNNSQVIIDSVAGTDMINYGLYLGCDCIITVVENHTNSIKVFEQIKSVARELNIPIYAVVNKARGEMTELTNSLGSLYLGNVSLDANLLDYDYTKVSEQTKTEAKNVWGNLQNQKFEPENKIQKLKQFEIKRIAK